MTIANAKPDLLITGPIGTSMVNAASSAWHDYLTVEAKITAAIAYAVSIGAKYCYVPDSFLPYTASLVTFNNAVQLIAEGGPGASEGVDVNAYGAAGNGVQDDTLALQAALAYAGQTKFATLGIGSQTVLLRPGIYNVTTTVTVNNQVVLRGAGREVSEIIAAVGWTNPTPNCVVRLGVAGANAFGARIENLDVNANASALANSNIIGIYGESLQDLTGADHVTIRAFGAAGFQVRAGTGSITSNNGYHFIDCAAYNGIAATGIGFDLDGGTATFTPILLGLIHSNASFVSNKCPAGFKFTNGQFFATQLLSEYATAAVQCAAASKVVVVGISANACTDAFLTSSLGCQAFSILNGGGTNLVNDTINSITIPVAGNNYVSAYLGGGYPPAVGSGLVTARATIPYSALMTPNLGAGDHFQITVTNGTAFTINNPSGYQPSAGSAATQEFTLDIFNNSGGAMGAVTFAAQYKLTGAFVAPATGFHRLYSFYWDGNNYREKFRSAADQAN